MQQNVVSTLNRGRHSLTAVMLAGQTLAFNLVIEPAVVEPAVQIHAPTVLRILIPGAVSPDAVTVHAVARAIARH